MILNPKMRGEINDNEFEFKSDEECALEDYGEKELHTSDIYL